MYARERKTKYKFWIWCKGACCWDPSTRNRRMCPPRYEDESIVRFSFSSNRFDCFWDIISSTPHPNDENIFAWKCWWWDFLMVAVVFGGTLTVPTFCLQSKLLWLIFFIRFFSSFYFHVFLNQCVCVFHQVLSSHINKNKIFFSQKMDRKWKRVFLIRIPTQVYDSDVRFIFLFDDIFLLFLSCIVVVVIINFRNFFIFFSFFFWFCIWKRKVVYSLCHRMRLSSTKLLFIKFVRCFSTLLFKIISFSLAFRSVPKGCPNEMRLVDKGTLVSNVCEYFSFFFLNPVASHQIEIRQFLWFRRFFFFFVCQCGDVYAYRLKMEIKWCYWWVLRKHLRLNDLRVFSGEKNKTNQCFELEIPLFEKLICIMLLQLVVYLTKENRSANWKAHGRMLWISFADN